MSRLNWILQDIQRLSRQELKLLAMRVIELIEARAAQDAAQAAVEPLVPSPGQPPSPIPPGDDIPLELLITQVQAVELDEEMAEDEYLEGLWPQG